MTELSFPRELRLLTPSEFTPVFKQPVVVSTPAFTFLAINNRYATPRLGLTIAKKRVKKAVARNRIKRLVRESFRLRRHQLPAIDVVVLAKNHTDNMSNEQLFKYLDKQWKKLAYSCKKA